METAPVSSDHHGLASIRCANVFDNVSVCLAGSDTYWWLTNPYRNYELIERAEATISWAMMNAEPMVARGVHNRALG